MTRTRRKINCHWNYARLSKQHDKTRRKHIPTKRRCDEKITKGAMKVGVVTEGSWGPSTQWHHLQCTVFQVQTAEEVEGYDDLEHALQVSFLRRTAPTWSHGRNMVTVARWCLLCRRYGFRRYCYRSWSDLLACFVACFLRLPCVAWVYRFHLLCFQDSIHSVKTCLVCGDAAPSHVIIGLLTAASRT